MDVNYPNEIDPILIAALVAKGGGNVTPEQIQAAVDAYLEANPVQAGKLQVDNHVINLTQEGE